MEQQKTMNGDNSLFENLKMRISKSTTARTIIFVLFLLAAGVMIILEATRHASITVQLMHSVLYVLCIIVGCSWMNSFNKMAKADDAAGLLAAYGKYKKMEKWVIAYSALAAVMLIISIIRSSSDLMLIILVLASTLFCLSKKDTTDIEQLRDLLPKS